MALFFFLVSSAPVLAVEGPVSRMQSKAAQNKTVQAVQLMGNGQWSLARSLIAEAKDPLASKIYYWMVFSKKKDFENFGRLAQFIRKNPEWPGVFGLKAKAERDMPSDLSSTEVIAWFDDYPPQTAGGVNRYMQALIRTGKQAKARKFIADWWASTTLSRDDQRWIFRNYKTYLDRSAHLRRFDTMLFRGQNTNAKALAGVLGKGYPELAAARIALAAEKSNVNALISRVPRHLRSDPGLMYERLRWRRKNKLNMGAAEILHNAPDRKKIQNVKSWWRERHILIRRMLEQKSYDSAYLLAIGHQQDKGTFEFAQAEWLAGWLALRFLNKPTHAYQHFEALYQNVKTPVSKSRGAYWAGRASSGFSDKSIRERWYKTAAQYQTVFYGQMAGAALGQAHTLPNAAPPKLTAEDIQRFNAAELIQASKVFKRAGLRDLSSDFLQAFVKHEGTSKAYRFGAETALDMGKTRDAVRISKEATRKGLFLTAQSYPVIAKSLQGIDLEWALIHGIIRQESLFDPKAESRVGARGLMQLMPATAKETAKKLGISHRTSWLTSNPAHNIKLGSTYLDQMVRRFDGSYPLAIAAYNAGPGRVDKWLKTFGDPRKGEIDFTDWIELIPIYETRNYVQRVMEAVYVYRLRLKDIQRPSNTPIHIAFSQK